MSLSSEIADLFASYSEPDDFTAQYQLELLGWRENGIEEHGYMAYTKLGCRCSLCRAGNRDHLRAWNMKRLGKTQTRAYRCGSCGGAGHSARTCEAQQARAA